jgi:hypothetical protein
MSVVSDLQYSPDLALCDFSLFPKLKQALQGMGLDDINTIQQQTQAVLPKIIT